MPLAVTLVAGVGVGEVELRVGAVVVCDSLTRSEGVDKSLTSASLVVAEHPARATNSVAREAKTILFITQR